MFVEIPSQIQEFFIQFSDSLFNFVHYGNPLLPESCIKINENMKASDPC